MSDAIRGIAHHLRSLREGDDAISSSRREAVVARDPVIEVVQRVRDLLLDRTPSADLESDLEVSHGLLTRLVGAEKASRLSARLPEIRSCLALDVQAAHHGDPAATNFSEIVTAYPSVLAVSTYRIAHALYQMDEPVSARIMSEYAHSKTGIDIHPGAFIGCHFFIDHGTGVVIGETTIIGNRVKLYHGVTLGAFSNRKGRLDRGKKRHPTLEDDVTIYPNATVLGGGTVVGKGAVIGGNVWLTSSVPPNANVTIENPRLRIRHEDESFGAGDYQI
jgi:serine O-acetyltransferase